MRCDRRDADAAEEARKQPPAGMTVDHLGTHYFSTRKASAGGGRAKGISK